MLFTSYIGSYLPSGKWLHVVEANVQWWRYTCALYRVRPNTMAKPVTKRPRGREQRHMNEYMLGCLQEQENGQPVHQYCCHSSSVSSRRGCFTKTPHFKPVHQYGCHSNSVSSRRGCFTKKKHVLNQAIAALKRSVTFPGWFVTV